MKKTIRTVVLSTLSALCGAVFCVPAHADVATFNNLNAVTLDADPIATFGPIADSFSTSNYGTTLDKVSFLLKGTSDAGSVTVKLLSDSATSPGAVLTTIGTINDSSLTGTLSDYSLTLATPFKLGANTRYWIELISNNSSADWAWSYDISGPGVATEYVSDTYGVFANFGNGPYQMEVNTAAPEPPAMTLLGIGLLGFAVLARKKVTV